MYNYNEMPEVTGFHQLEIEKVCRISTMLEKMMDVPFLKDLLSLIGGTAINFIYTKPLTGRGWQKAGKTRQIFYKLILLK